MADASQQEIVEAWSNVGGDARHPADNALKEQFNTEKTVVGTDSNATVSAFDSARALGTEAANRTDMQESEKSKLAEIRKRISDMFKPRQKTPQTA